ncbi:hypothetical protein M0654_12300 [Rhizobium sp. NTR19]|uniref:Allophanate hydrolase C-terminal domain-containing protein n=1 Tax=Neorhizobium turbinariae TaxID=2937795 RepID=A0ABT0ISC2_9HYPH|nr:hypothetical protein [Neorhizobium turbinariae]MCK8780766.1 hypothetical protein [Neorhizobium turbinariae]
MQTNESEYLIDLVVVGAHLSGMPLNKELVELDAKFVRLDATTSDYRLFELPGTAPRKPGLLRVESEAGAAIEVEVWALTPKAFGLFVSRIPSPLGIGTVKLRGGAAAKGFLVEEIAVREAEDISRFGGWRAFRRSVEAAA